MCRQWQWGFVAIHTFLCLGWFAWLNNCALFIYIKFSPSMLARPIKTARVINIDYNVNSAELSVRTQNTHSSTRPQGIIKGKMVWHGPGLHWLLIAFAFVQHVGLSQTRQSYESPLYHPQCTSTCSTVMPGGGKTEVWTKEAERSASLQTDISPVFVLCAGRSCSHCMRTGEIHEEH